MSISSVQMSVYVAALAVSVCSILWMLRSKMKKNYVHVGKVTKIFFYPIKSIKGIEVESADCIEKGINVDGSDDRCYMVVSGDGVLCSQRQEPRLALLTPSISGKFIKVNGPDTETLTLDLKPTLSAKDKIIFNKVHEEVAPSVDCGDEAAAWFQKFLKRPDVRLVFSAEGRQKRKMFRDNRPMRQNIRNTYPVSFQDAVPYHLLSQESVDSLNTTLENTKVSVSVRNFRPNILVEGCNAYDEDKWRYIKFSGGAEIVHVIPCARCIMTTNDPDTGIKTDKEPLITLRKHRPQVDPALKAGIGTGPRFGVDCGLLKKGRISVGDDVFAVVEEKPFKY